MSQMQSEVRPQVLRMPKTGFSLQTGGSARRRIIKPQYKQTATDQFPIENRYRVSGVPGHTHNSSAVLSVLVDLKRDRNFNAILHNVWAHDAIDFEEKHLATLKSLRTRMRNVPETATKRFANRYAQSVRSGRW